MNWSNVLGPLVGLVATALGGWIATRITAPKDHDRAALLSRIAEEAAALVYSLNPNAAWADMLRDVVARIASAAGLPTSSAQAIENAAASALIKLGKSPAVSGVATK
jgi:hypothetical protein